MVSRSAKGWGKALFTPASPSSSQWKGCCSRCRGGRRWTRNDEGPTSSWLVLMTRRRRCVMALRRRGGRWMLLLEVTSWVTAAAATVVWDKLRCGGERCE